MVAFNSHVLKYLLSFQAFWGTFMIEIQKQTKHFYDDVLLNHGVSELKGI